MITTIKQINTSITSYSYHFLSFFLFVVRTLKIYSLFFCFLGSHPWHKEVPRLGAELELQLLAYTTAREAPDPSLICDLHHSSRQCWILNSLSETRDWTTPSQTCDKLSHLPPVLQTTGSSFPGIAPSLLRWYISSQISSPFWVFTFFPVTLLPK